MASPSSTSSSDAPVLRGFPWGLASAILIMALVEVAVRFAPPEQRIAYDRGLQEHFAVANCLATLGPADIGFVGSSMTREGVAAPMVREELQTATGSTFRVANYAAGGLDADEGNALVNYMIRNGAAPRLLCYEVSPLHLRPFLSFKAGRLAIFWSLRDWIYEWTKGHRPAPEALPVVLRQEIGRYWLTLRHRERLGQWVREWLGIFQRPPMPALGEYNGNWDTRAFQISLGNPARKERLLNRWIVRHRRGYPKIDRRLVVRLDRTIQACQQRGIPIVLYEMPISPSAQKTFPPEVYEDFYRRVGNLAKRRGVQFCRITDMGVSILDDYFVDMTHMNQPGCETMSRVLAEKVILPQLAAAIPEKVTSAE